MKPASLDEPIRKAAVLVEALPFMQAFRGQTFLIKVGGSAMEDPRLVRNLMRDIVFLEVVGVNPVIVHGGGKAISAAMAEKGIEPRWVNGLRVTGEEAIGVVEQTLGGEINPGLVKMLDDFGGKAVGVSGREVFQATRLRPPGEDGSPTDIGAVGSVIDCHLPHVIEAIRSETVPVVSPLASEVATGHTLNVNADLAAAALARALGAHKLIYLSDVLGLMRNPEDEETLISTIDRGGIASLIDDGIISGGMIPKMNSAIEAIEAGVHKVHLIDGRIAHSLLLEVFTNLGIGTEITRE